MGIWGKIEKGWAALPPLRQFLLGALFVYVATELLNLLRGFVSWSPFVTALDFLRHWILNPTVACSLATGLIVGFWGPIIAATKKRVQLLHLFGTVCLVVSAMFLIPFLIDEWTARNDPELFELSGVFLKNAQTLKMDFLHVQPSQLVQIYRDNTTLTADGIIKPSIGKWVAITGIVYDIPRPDDGKNLQIYLYGAKTNAILDFYGVDRGPIWQLQKGKRIKALCKLVTVDRDSVGLSYCALVP